MPSIDINTYKIDFLVLDTNDSKTIATIDQSFYLSEPQLPLLEITPPGYTGALQVPYRAGGITVLNSDNLTITDVTECGELADLQDGVYQIKQMVCPYDELFIKKCYLKTTNFYKSLQAILLNFDIYKDTYEENKLRNSIIDLFILIESAKAETYLCNIQQATNKYTSALNKLNSINKQCL